MSVDTALETTILMVDHLGLPEMQDVVFQHILHLTSHCLDSHHIDVTYQTLLLSSTWR